jgi:hypothetical protein
MVESISQRLQREKADLERLGLLHEGRGAGRNFAITFSSEPSLPRLDKPVLTMS